ncbi:DNA-directed RNA polymerase alpha subunit domain [hydrothermal vent metagenome]|uniref:DNA-directed RNA polymerase alpha subunit domain n=1 Tax=hydrothermal vent metagenome TaxID=652676 RepID=A0A3B1D8V8_9ZZZZ
MLVAELIDVSRIVESNQPVSGETISQIHEVISGAQVGELRVVATSLQNQLDSGIATGEAFARAGVCWYFLGQHEAADSAFSQAPNGPFASFYHALTLSALGRHEESAGQFVEAQKAGYDAIECSLRQAGEVRMQGDLDSAENMLRGIASKAAGRAEYSYQMGCILSDRGDTYGAIEYFERAADMDTRHARALFRLAVENSSRGNDDDAIRLYEQALSKPPFYLGALLNLGLLYDDRENYNAAAFCFKRVLDFDPNHERAKLYLLDVEATSDMYYDEEYLREEAKLSQLLSRPITDFELSVRSRNCLQGMDIHSLGDLTEISEQDLLAGKNFGETSLHEIREMLTSHNLRIGQNLSKGQSADFQLMAQSLSPQEQQVLNQPIGELNLSVRSRKCMSRLGIDTFGELLQKTPDELLGSRNFGVTSLNEIRLKLGELDLKLRND